MIYTEPIFRVGGDSFVTMELGDDGSLFLNLHILALEKLILKSAFLGLIDTTAMRTTIMVHYDPLKNRYDKVIKHLRQLSTAVRVPSTIRSRLIHLPVYYDDPLTRKCAREFGMDPNIEIVAVENGLSVAEVIKAHTEPKYFVSYISFTFGSFGAFPINEAVVLKNSKYKNPRKWTPPGTIGIGGNTTFLYSSPSPGGLMMLGNVPVKSFDLDGRNPIFKKDPLLIRPGDMVKLHSIQADEYAWLKEHADEYCYQIEDSWIDTTNL